MSSTRSDARPPRSLLSLVHTWTLALLLGLHSIAWLGCASDPAPTPAPAGSMPAESTLRDEMRAGPVTADPLFWRVEPDGGATLHLLGSIHFGPPGGWRLSAPIEAAFARSRALVVEADDRDVDETQMQAIMLRHALAPAGSTLADLVPASTLDELTAHMQARGQGIETLLPFRPWMVATVVTMGTVAELGFAPDTGIDHDFLRRGGEREVIPLETVESQLAIFGRLTPELDALFLSDTLDQVGEAGAMLLEMAEAWRSGDETTLARLMSDSFEQGGELAELHDALIIERNRAMSERLAALARDADRSGQEIFVVIGAAHFVGDESIREMLARDHDLHATPTLAAPAAAPAPGPEDTDAP